MSPTSASCEAAATYAREALMPKLCMMAKARSKSRPMMSRTTCTVRQTHLSTQPQLWTRTTVAFHAAGWRSQGCAHLQPSGLCSPGSLCAIERPKTALLLSEQVGCARRCSARFLGRLSGLGEQGEGATLLACTL